MKVLLDFKANIEARSPDGETPLCAVARVNTSAHALFLMENNADLNALTKDGKTPLTTAIAHNNHDVLRILLDCWSKCGTCPRLIGPNLLGVVADFADVHTIRILSDCEHFQLRGDKQYAMAIKASERIRSRANVSEEIVAAFDQFIGLISQAGEEMEDGLLEKGILRRSTNSSSSSGDTAFLDALDQVDFDD
ncbi:hypothetical protein N0V94_009070 [Neodidymelliopsis sp. IMI 364377]|nr:hypothetical protein N0V94_009070 [Neodidymelliopsis sp. IMI 364377]